MKKIQEVNNAKNGCLRQEVIRNELIVNRGPNYICPCQPYKDFLVFIMNEIGIWGGVEQEETASDLSFNIIPKSVWLLC